jgi:hypothetical protein
LGRCSPGLTNSNQPAFDDARADGIANRSLTDPVPLEDDVAGMASYLGGIPAFAAKPIWITEFGISWAFNGYSLQSIGCSNSFCYAPPVGTPTSVSYGTAGVSSFLTGFTTWRKANGPTLRIQRWFLYVDWGRPESYMTVYAGIDAMTDAGSTAELSPAGVAYRTASASP